ncbi:hypothetical protein [Sphingomonas hankookensis]|uniref:hypothetical protein n=1 Tax=Sphingomonas hankookensis TaxID=563996 RepID=UPI003D3024B0
MRRAVVALLALAGCSGEPAPPPPPAPQPSGQPTPPPAATPSPRQLRPGQLPTPELDGAVPLAGDWSSERDAAIYTVGGRIAFAVRCDRAARRILLSRGVGEGIRSACSPTAPLRPSRRRWSTARWKPR